MCWLLPHTAQPQGQGQARMSRERRVAQRAATAFTLAVRPRVVQCAGRGTGERIKIRKTDQNLTSRGYAKAVHVETSEAPGKTNKQTRINVVRTRAGSTLLSQTNRPLRAYRLSNATHATDGCCALDQSCSRGTAAAAP
eukprot:5952755-Prymnesium_polylepis.1